jgi:Uncharacterized conserved protein
MYAAVLRPCPGREMFMLSVFEARSGAAGGYAFRDALMLTRAELQLLDVDVQALSEGGPSDGRTLDLFTRRRLTRCARLFALALQVLQDRRSAARWLKTPQQELGGSIPLKLVQTEIGARTVERVLGRMEHGAMA